MKRFIILILFCTLILSACKSKSDPDKKATEESSQSYVVGYINPHPIMTIFFEKYREEMEALGYVDGKNITYIEKGPPEQLAEIILYPSQLVEANVDLMMVVATEGGILAKAATDQIPILFVAGDQPIETGLVASLERPGGNITGIIASGPEARRLQLFLEMVPTMKKIYAPYNPADVQSRQSFEELESAANDLGLELLVTEVRNEEDLAAAIENIPAEADGIFIVQDVIISTEMQTWGTTAIAHKLPLSAPGAGEPGTASELPTSPLMGYGIYIPDLAQKAARLTDQILKGGNPAEIPVEDAEFYLMVNTRTAEAIGVEIPDSILAQADIIIRE